ncbi:MAG: multidrug efflux SMR transporter [Nitrospirota bacterium]|nr:multidrug efflux SMR transporter [Nitrospirota bacterium]
MPYVYLLLAVIADVAGTAALQLSRGMTRPGPALASVVAFGAAFFLLSLVLKSIPMGVAYAVWSGLGIVLIAVVGVVAFHQRPDLPAVLGLALIVAGVVVIRLFSRTVNF